MLQAFIYIKSQNYKFISQTTISFRLISAIFKSLIFPLIRLKQLLRINFIYIYICLKQIGSEGKLQILLISIWVSSGEEFN